MNNALHSRVSSRTHARERARGRLVAAPRSPTRPSCMIEVICNDRLGKKIRVKCNPDDTVGDLKKLLAAQTGTRPEKLRIQKWYTVYKDHITLDDYEIHDGMGLELYCARRTQLPKSCRARSADVPTVCAQIIESSRGYSTLFLNDAPRSTVLAYAAEASRKPQLCLTYCLWRLVVPPISLTADRAARAHARKSEVAFSPLPFQPPRAACANTRRTHRMTREANFTQKKQSLCKLCVITSPSASRPPSLLTGLLSSARGAASPAHAPARPRRGAAARGGREVRSMAWCGGPGRARSQPQTANHRSHELTQPHRVRAPSLDRASR